MEELAETVLEEFVTVVPELDDAEIFDACMEMVKRTEWYEYEEIYQQFLDVLSNEYKGSPRVLHKISILNFLHEMANQVDQVVETIGNIIVPLVQELLQSPLLIQNSEGKTEASVWEAVEAWKDNTALPMKVFTELKERKRKREEEDVGGEAKRAKITLTAQTMKVYEKQQTLESAEYSLEATTNWAVQEEMQSKAQIKSSNRKVDQWLREGGPGREICNINFMLPATKALPLTWKVNTASVAPFMDKLTNRITEVLVDHPQLGKTIGEVLQKLTLMRERVEQSKRLQSCMELLGDVAGGRVGLWQFEESLRALVAPPPAENKTATLMVAEDGDEGSDEYDPMADISDAGGGGEANPAHYNMKTDETHYLPPPTGHASSQMTPPALGPMHILSRVWHMPKQEWVERRADHTTCEPLRVLLVRREVRPDRPLTPPPPLPTAVSLAA